MSSSHWVIVALDDQLAAPSKRRRFWTTFMVVVSLSSSACGEARDAPPTPSPPQAGSPQRMAPPSTLWSDDPAISRPWMLATAGDLILLANARPPHLHVFRADGAERIRSLFTQGEGPGDFATAPSPVRSESVNDTLWVIDPILRRATAIPKAALRPSVASLGLRTLPVGPDRPMSLARAPDGTFFGVVVSAQRELKLVSIAHEDGTQVARVSAPLHADDPRFLASELYKAYNLRVCLRPSGDQAALVYNHAGRIDLYSTSDLVLTPASVPYPFLPPVTIREGTGEPVFSGRHPDGRSAYMDCLGTQDRVYALFQGKPWIATADSLPPPPSELHEFDWGGRLLGVTILDHSTFTFTLSRDGTELLTINEGPEGWEIRSTKGAWQQ